MNVFYKDNRQEWKVAVALRAVLADVGGGGGGVSHYHQQQKICGGFFFSRAKMIN